jgi:hypothetical protein
MSADNIVTVMVYLDMMNLFDNFDWFENGVYNYLESVAQTLKANWINVSFAPTLK